MDDVKDPEVIQEVVMLKRILSLLLVTAMLLAVFTVLPASAAEVSDETAATAAEEKEYPLGDGVLKYEIGEDSAVITGSGDLAGDIVLPDTIEGHPVAAIGASAFDSQGYITSVVIPDTVTDIGIGAFINCTSLSSVTIPASVTSVGDFAFSGCISLTEVTLSANLTEIGGMAFGYTDDSEKIEGFTVSGYKDTAAQLYAAENGFDFIDLLADTYYPHITGFTNAEKGVQISWEPYEGAYAYRLYYKSASGWTRIAQTTGTSFTYTGAQDGEELVYTLRCVDQNNHFVSEFKTEGWSHVFFAPPVINSIGSITEGVELKWDRTAGAGDYRVYRRTAGSSWTRLAQTDETDYLDNTVESGVKYIYTLRMVSAEDGSFMSDYLSGKTITYVSTPVIKSIENTEKGAKLSWDAVPGADFYRIYYKNANGGWTRLASKYLTEYVDTSAKGGEDRIYTIRCLNEQEQFVSDFDRGGWSNTFISAPVIKTLKSAEDGVEIVWDACAGAEKYRVYYKNAKGGWTRMVDTTETSYVDTDVRSGSRYTYTVRCINSDATRFTSGHNSGKSLLYVAAPRFTSIENISGGVKLSWDAVKGADFYRLYYKNANGGWTRLASKYLTEFTDTSVKDGETRVYTIRCMSESGDFLSDFVHEGWSNTYHAAPEITSVSRSGSSSVIKWKAVDGVAGYRLYRKGLNGSWARLFDVIPDTSYTDATAEEDEIYAYTLRLVDEDGKLISSFLNDTKYYLNGKVADGRISYLGDTYAFNDGYLFTGKHRVGGKLYYYNSKGVMYKDAVVGNSTDGYYYADSNGVCCESQEMRLAAEFIAKYCKGSTLKEKMKYGFLYMAKNYPYVRVYNDTPADEKDIPPFAVELFELKAGTCYRYAAAFACVAKIAGYRSRFCFGYSGTLSHGWTEVYVDGRWYYCDVDAQLPGYGFPDYYPYMTREHVWILDKRWYSELTLKDGKAVWGKKTSY